MSEVNYKSKYEQLKARMHSAVDMAFRLGYENGMQASQVQQAADHATQMNAMSQAEAGAPEQAPPGAEGGEQPGEEQAGPQSEHPGGSELDQHIAKLESMIAKGELNDVDRAELSKSLEGFRAFKQKIDLAKSTKIIDSIGKSMKAHKVRMGQQAAANLTHNAKKALSLQEQIVSDVMKSWAAEESRVSKDIANVVAVEGLTKKE